MPIQIQTAKGWRRLQEAFSIVGRHRLMLDEVVVPVAILEDLTLQPDTANDRATLSITCPAEALERSACVLFNTNAALDPTGAILLVERVYMTSGLVGNISINQTTVAPLNPIAGSVIRKLWNDPSQPAVPAGTGFADGSAFGAAGEIYIGTQLANTPFVVEVNQILPALAGLAVVGGAINTEIKATFQYRVVATRD